MQRALRRIPEFRALSRDELRHVLHQMVCKSYEPGEVLWREGNRVDFLGIIKSGEIFIEYRRNGSTKRSIRLAAGDCVRPSSLDREGNRSSVRACAGSQLSLYVLQIEQLKLLKLKSLVSDVIPASARTNSLSFFLRFAWAAALVTLILAMNWNDFRHVIAGVLFLRAEHIYQGLYDYPGTLGLLRYAEFAAPNSAFTYNREGYLRYKHHELSSAAAAFARAVEADQTYGPSLNNLAFTYFDKGDISQAMFYQREATENDPDQAIALYNLGIIQMYQGQETDAIRSFGEASFIDPAWALPHLQRGFLYLNMRSYGSAEEAARVAIARDPTQQSAHMILGIALYNQKEYPDALSAVERALELSPEDNIAGFYRALILNELGKTEAALATLHRILDSTSDPQQTLRIQAEIEAIHFYLEHPASGGQ